MFNTDVTPAAGPIEKLWVLYDPSCGFCVSCRRWLERQPAWLPMEFLPAGSPEALAQFPGLEGTGEELTVVGGDGAVYRGGSAWLTCLWALREYRGLAERLSSPALLPYARQAFELVARNRRELSRRLRLLPEDDLRDELGQVAPTCAKPPLPYLGIPERGGPGMKIVLAMAAAILAFVIIGTWGGPISQFLVARGIVRNAAALRVIGFDPQAALRQAAADGRVDRIRALVRAGTDPNGRSAAGISPLYEAATRNRRESVEALLALGADPLARDAEGRPLPVAVVETGGSDVLSLLRAPRSVWSWRDASGQTPLLRAIGRQQLAAVRAILGAGADPNEPGIEDTPLARACDFGKLDVIDALLAAKADPNAKDAAGDPPLVRLARLQPGYFGTVADRLIAAGADVNWPGAKKMTPLITASLNGDPRVPKQLVQRGADPNLRDEAGRSALSYACEKGAILTVESLLAAGANPNSRDSHGRTPLMDAVQSSEPNGRLIFGLVEAGADLNATDAEGHTALDLARRTADGRPVAWILEAQRRAENPGSNVRNTRR